MLTISYSETLIKGTLSTWQRCTLATDTLPTEQSSELEKLVSASGVLEVDGEVVLPADAVQEGVHWTVVVESADGRHKIIGKSARTPNLPLQDTEPDADPDSEGENPLNYERLSELLQFLKPHLKSGFAAES